jgi:hypothetical protein
VSGYAGKVGGSVSLTGSFDPLDSSYSHALFTRSGGAGKSLRSGDLRVTGAASQEQSSHSLSFACRHMLTTRVVGGEVGELSSGGWVVLFLFVALAASLLLSDEFAEIVILATGGFQIEHKVLD